MSSGIETNFDGARGIINGAAEDMSRFQNLGMSPRQRQLDKLFQWYSACQYDARESEWDGSKHIDPLDKEVIAHRGYIPPGFYDFGQSLPLKFRRPASPYHLARTVVHRFTGMLFSERRHPKFKVEGDPDTEDSAHAIAEVCRLWPTMITARNMGGAMGSVAVGFRFLDGKPRLQIHDPRWSTPHFKDRETLELAALEKLWMYPVDAVDAKGHWIQVWYWSRRVVDEKEDVVYLPQRVNPDGIMPQWDQVESRSYVHNFGFCPIKWIQNIPVYDDIDGEPDCHGMFDMLEEMDCLIAQASRGILLNCFGAETQFITDKGVRRFTDFCDGDNVRTLGHSGQWRNARVKSYGEQGLWAVTLTRGGQGKPIVIRATRDHRWLLADGTETTELSVGDRVLSAPTKFSDFEYETASQDERAAWCAGFVYGDGAHYKSQGKVIGCQVRLCGNKIKYTRRFTDNGFRLRTPDYFNGDAHLLSHDMRKQLPTEDTALEMLRAFVRGYVDADASKRKRGNKSSRWNRMQVTGEDAVDFVRWAFPTVGLYISSEVDMTGTSTNYGPRTANTIRFEINENGSDHWNSLYKVAAVEDLNVTERVWCLEVEGDRSFCLPCGIATGNCDPTLLLNTEQNLADIAKGSDNAIKLPGPGDKASYLELAGTGPKAAMEQVEKLRKMVLEVVECVLDHPDHTVKTATEINRMYSPMMGKADKFREQYGEAGIKPLMEMIVRAAKQLGTGYDDGNGSIIKSPIALPKKQVGDKKVDRKFGEGVEVQLRWPSYFEPSLDDVSTATDAAGKAKLSGLIDNEHASAFVAEYYRVEDVPAMMKKIKDEQKQAAQEQQQQVMQGMEGLDRRPGREREGES